MVPTMDKYFTRKGLVNSFSDPKTNPNFLNLAPNQKHEDVENKMREDYD
jgi:hypothetical protein